jgi:hypothetical protein
MSGAAKVLADLLSEHFDGLEVFPLKRLLPILKLGNDWLVAVEPRAWQFRDFLIDRLARAIDRNRPL